MVAHYEHTYGKTKQKARLEAPVQSPLSRKLEPKRRYHLDLLISIFSNPSAIPNRALDRPPAIAINHQKERYKVEQVLDSNVRKIRAILHRHRSCIAPY